MDMSMLACAVVVNNPRPVDYLSSNILDGILFVAPARELSSRMTTGRLVLGH